MSMVEQNGAPQPVTLQVPTTVRSLIEALIFGAREPLNVRQIQVLYEDQPADGGEPRKIDFDSIKQIVAELNAEYAAADRAYRIVEIAGGYQFATLPAYAEWLGKLYKEQARRKLSQSSIETLAIIAYKQPITKPEIESIRGVNCDYVLSTLLEKDLATIVGRAPTVGRPLLYGSSKEFLKHFGLNDLNDLPRPREIQEILGDSQFESERRMLEAQQDVVEKKEEEFKSRLPHIPKRKPELDDDVKIMHKKRSREIKVRQTDQSAQEPAEEMIEGTPIEDTQEIPVSDAISKESVSLDVTEQPGQDEVLIPKNDSYQTELGADGGEPPAEDSKTPPDAMKYAALTRSPGEETQVSEQAEAPSQVDETINERQSQGVSAAFPNQPAVPQERTNDSEVRSEREEPVAEVIQGETTLHVGSDFVPESNTIEEVEAGIPPAEVPQETETPLPVPAAPETLTQGTVETHPASLDQDGETVHHSSQSKSRWSSWKEKIQGFIKKLFG